jgi:hypothetical protein
VSVDHAPPPYRAATAVAGVVLAGYLVTLAPSVTFWDAGEFIAATRTLGIPHPPGTPLFVLIAHLWATLLPIGEYAARTNFLSALLSALGAGFLFLVAHESLGPATGDLPPREGVLLRIAGAVAAALIGAFTFTQWQNSNETEVYAVAGATIAVTAWLCLVWRRRRRSGGAAANLLLLVLYIAGLSIGNHLLALLVGPAVVMFLWATLRAEPGRDRSVRQREWAEVAVVAGTWALLIGMGLGSEPLSIVGGALCAGALIFAAVSGSAAFGLAGVALAVFGITTYYFLYLRSGQHPPLNEAQPDTWHSLLLVIRRAQYPVRTPLDDPTVLHGPDNPGRTLGILWLQLINYLQYFDWQWANGVPGGIPVGKGMLPWRTGATLLFASLGLQGLLLQRRSDRSAWWLCLTIFLTTGLVLMLYMNFKFGFSLARDRYPDPSQHEVRERDYFFVVSYILWGWWAGLGLVALARRVLEWRPSARGLAASVFGIAALPFLLNFTAASRRHGADARLPGDFAYDLLNSVPPYGVLFTYGDNDTFPLWWAQEVAGVRRDVTVICLALAQTDWYMRQLRDRPPGDFDEAGAPPYWRGRHPAKPDWPLHTMTDAEIASARPTMLSDSLQVDIGPMRVTYPARTVFYTNDILVVRVLQQNLGRRPIMWALTAGGNFAGLNRNVIQRGMGFALEPSPIDTTAPGVDATHILGAPLDVPATDTLAWQVYRYADLLTRGAEGLEPTSRGVAGNLSLPFTRLADHYDRAGDTEQSLANLERAARLAPSPAMDEALTTLRLRLMSPDSGPPAAPLR